MENACHVETIRDTFTSMAKVVSASSFAGMKGVAVRTQQAVMAIACFGHSVKA
jgi:hypothetical protein